MLIALGAFWLSFTALTDLAIRAGVPEGQAWVWPLIVDGLIVVATASVVALAPAGRHATIYPWLLLVVGATVSVTGNAAHATITTASTLPDAAAAAISAVPPLVLLAVTHLSVLLIRPTPTAQDIAAIHAGKRQQADTDADETSVEGDRRDLAREWRAQGWSNKRIARELDVHPSTVGRWLNHTGS